MKNLILILCVFVFVSNYAQIDKEKALSPRAELKLADLLYAQGFYYSATEYYKEALRAKPNWRYAKYWLAMSYAKSKDYKNAETWFNKFVNYKLQPKDKIKKIEQENKTIFNKARFYYAEALKANGKYAEAIKQYKAFKAEYAPDEKKKKDKEDKNWNAKANIEIKGAEWAIEQAATFKKIKLKNIGEKVNSAYEEAAPVSINDSTIYFTSLGKDNLVYINKAKEIPPYKIFQSKKVNGEWQKGKELPSYINDEKLSTGNAAVSEDGKRMYFCKCYNNEVDEVICAINFSSKKENKWSRPIMLNDQINDPRFTSTQPAVRTSGDNFDIVYFVSDREGGKGGMDIWYFIRTAKGNYKGPRLLRGPINTQFDELTPFYNNYDSTFYFSSNGHPSIGGFDVFKTIEDDEDQWIEPMNVGAPINSTKDDLYYVNEQGKTSGFIVSNRDGTSLIRKRYRGDDIFYFEDFKFGLEGLVTKDGKNDSGETLVDDAKVKLFAVNEFTGKKELVKEVNVKDGEYFFELKPDLDYTVEVIKPGFASTFEEISTKNLMQEDTISKDLSVEKTNIVAAGSLFNEDDSLGTNKLNGALVTLREKQADGSFKTVTAQKITSSEPNYYFNLDVSKNYEVKITKDGYFAKTMEFDLSKVTPDQDTIYSNAMISKIEVGKAYALENILYEFGKADLTKESETRVAKLAKIMQENPLIIVELSAHTDAIGSDASNLKLSQARAQSCVDYLKKVGISDARLVAKGYGETIPVAPNKNEDGSDNEVGRAKNRRTEFKVLGGL
ncbi:MAG: OmpA family protein [Chitinophagales bacterium]